MTDAPDGSRATAPTRANVPPCSRLRRAAPRRRRGAGGRELGPRRAAVAGPVQRRRLRQLRDPRGRRRRRRPDRRDGRLTSPQSRRSRSSSGRRAATTGRPTSTSDCAAHGLEPDEVETVMVGQASHLAVDVELPAGVTVRRVDTSPSARRSSARPATCSEMSSATGTPVPTRWCGSSAWRVERPFGSPRPTGRSSAPAGSTSGARAPSSPASGAVRRCPSGAAAASTAR